MNEDRVPAAITALADRWFAIPNVVAVTLQHAPQPSADRDALWELGLYFRGPLSSAQLLSVEGVVALPGEWDVAHNAHIPVVYEGLPVEIQVREIDTVLHWIAEAEDGRFDVDTAPGHLAGRPTYSLAAELVLDRVLAGSLDTVHSYPERLADLGAAHWLRHASASLDHAQSRAARGDVAGVLGHLTRAAVEAAHSRLCEARTWTRNEKEILEQAELTHLSQILTAVNADPVTLMQRVMQARALLLD